MEPAAWAVVAVHEEPLEVEVAQLPNLPRQRTLRGRQVVLRPVAADSAEEEAGAVDSVDLAALYSPSVPRAFPVLLRRFSQPDRRRAKSLSCCR